MAIPAPDHRLDSVAALEGINGQPGEGARRKVIRHLDRHARAFIDRCPFLMLATGSNVGTDCSPRGDAPGFLVALDDTTLLIPERPGNRRADSLRNILANPAVGLLCMIPGMNETLRVNGDACIVRDAELLERFRVGVRAPLLGIWIDVKEVYFHCPKAFIRSKLWDPATQMDRKSFPTLGAMVLEQINGAAPAVAQLEAIDAALAADCETNLY